MYKSSFMKITVWFVAVFGLIQTSLSQEFLTNFGESINGVTLSVDLTNRVIGVDSTMRLPARIKNASTNVISLDEADILSDFTVFLARDSGKIYKQLTPKPSGHYYRTFEMNIAAGKAFDWNIPLIIVKDIEPGEYMLVATRRFWIGKSSYELVSNMLKVQITK